MQDGMLRCAKYAFSPNRLKYCGPDKNKDLFEYCAKTHVDPGLGMLLKEFEVMYPYLKLIADENNIVNPFDEKVVEAYWIGNELLNNVKMNKLYYHLIDEQQLKKRTSMKLLNKIVGRIPVGAKPHHAFHVFNVPFRTGKLTVDHTLETMDKCRISWGKILKVEGSGLNVESCPLLSKNGKFYFGEKKNLLVNYKYGKEQFIKDPKKGYIITFHWDWACEVITEQQKDQLKAWTIHHLKIANLSYA